jgi:hypothetical protein
MSIDQFVIQVCAICERYEGQEYSKRCFLNQLYKLLEELQKYDLDQQSVEKRIGKPVTGNV